MQLALKTSVLLEHFAKKSNERVFWDVSWWSVLLAPDTIISLRSSRTFRRHTAVTIMRMCTPTIAGVLMTKRMFVAVLSWGSCLRRVGPF